MYIYTHTHTHIYIYILYIYIYIYHTHTYIGLYEKIKINYKTCHKKKTVLLLIKSPSGTDPWFRHGFGAEASLPGVFHNTTRLYWVVFDLYECHICSDAVTGLSRIFLIHSPFLLVKVRLWLKM